MKLTDIFKFKLFERTDPVDMKTVNENFESVEKLFKGLDQVDNTSDCDKNVASAKKAECDGNGKNISETYLKKTAVANNNTTTEAGFALDARQANPNVDGSLAKQISALNSSLMLRPIYPLYTGRIAVSGTRDVPYEVTEDGYIQFWYQVDDDKNNSNCGIICYIDGTIVHEYFEYHQAGAANENYSALFPVLRGQTAQFHIITDSVTQSAMIYYYPNRA